MEIQTLEKGVKILNDLFHEFYSIHLTPKNNNSIIFFNKCFKISQQQKKKEKEKKETILLLKAIWPWT